MFSKITTKELSNNERQLQDRTKKLEKKKRIKLPNTTVRPRERFVGYSP